MEDAGRNQEMVVNDCLWQIVFLCQKEYTVSIFGKS